ncbi:MAG: nucleotidyltransferase domain-containing protein [Alphaproteobacteria bacterium]|nr:nucleotidyltransferase domain-containing protein [Alphaproteobacteria bacterium]
MEPLEFWLFGSRAEGRARPESDYDILVIVPDGALDEWLDPRRTWQVAHDAGVIADIIPCTKRDFDERRTNRHASPPGIHPGHETPCRVRSGSSRSSTWLARTSMRRKTWPGPAITTPRT